MASPPNDNNNKAVLLAEELRQKGNKAYLSKDFKQALEWYQKSNAQKEDARCYSNVAEVYLKLGDYASAREAAERATTLKPDWAKPWWRKGRIAELFKDFESAINYYEIAVKQEPKNKEYRKALRNCEKRMKIIEKIPEGHYVVEPPTSSSDMEGQSPAMKAWKRVGKRFGGHMACWNSKYDAAKKTPEISSEEWLFKGLNIWVAGMKGSIAYLGLRMSPEARTAYLQMNGGLGPTNMAFQVQ